MQSDTIILETASGVMSYEARFAYDRDARSPSAWDFIPDQSWTRFSAIRRCDLVPKTDAAPCSNLSSVVLWQATFVLYGTRNVIMMFLTSRT